MAAAQTYCPTNFTQLLVDYEQFHWNYDQNQAILGKTSFYVLAKANKSESFSIIFVTYYCHHIQLFSSEYYIHSNSRISYKTTLLQHLGQIATTPVEIQFFILQFLISIAFQNFSYRINVFRIILKKSWKIYFTKNNKYL